MSVFGRKKRNRSGRRSQIVANQKTSAYHYSASRLDSQKTAHRQVGSLDQKPKSWNRRALVGMGFVLLIVAFLLVFSTLSETPEITQSKVNSEQNTEAYKRSVTKNLQGSIRNKSKLTLDRDAIIDDLKRTHPDINSVRISTPLLSRNVHVAIESTEPALRLLSGARTYILSTDGRVLGDASLTNISNADDLPSIMDKSAVTISIGKPALTSQQVSYIKQVIAQSSSKGLKVSSMELAAGGGELDVRYANLPYLVKFNFFEDARKSSGALFAVKDRLEIENNSPKEYIDVRVPERAYVR